VSRPPALEFLVAGARFRHFLDEPVPARQAICEVAQNSLAIDLVIRKGHWAAQRRGVKFGRKVKLTPEQIDHARS
jgi:hypothetical protein